MASATSIFVIDLVGEVSGEKFSGSFTTKLRLSHAEQFRRDEIRRKLLGANSENASPRANNAAEVFSELAVHLTEVPSWWSGSNGGLELVDDNVVGAVFDAVMLEKKKAADEIKKKAEEAKVELKK